MEFKHILILGLALCLVLPMLSAGQGDLYKIYPDKVLINNVEVQDSDIWIDGFHLDDSGNRVYHIDSLRDLYIDENNESNNERVLLYLPLPIQPDWIQHTNHDKEKVGYYFPTNENWEWEYECEEQGHVDYDEDCMGNVILRVDKIDKGLGSNTFPIGITGSTWANDRQGFGEFDGESSNVDVSNANFNGGVNFTYSMWVKSNSVTQISASSFFRAKSLDAFGFLVEGTTNIFQFRVSNGTDQINTIGITVPIDNYIHIIGKANDTSITTYVNGVFNSSNNYAGTLLTDNDLFIGYEGASDRFFNGLIDEVLIYNRSLSQAEITALFNNYTEISTGINRTGTIDTNGLVLDINFDDFSVADNSGQGNHGTNTNVSFGEVFSIKRLLTEGVDYSIVGALFTILNSNLQWTGINIDWDYTSSSSCSAINLTNIEEQFGLFVTGMLAFLGVIGTILGIVWLVFYIKKLFNKESGINHITA